MEPTRPLFDNEGQLDPPPTPTQEFIALYPLPYAIVSGRMLLISACIVLCLVLHNALLLFVGLPEEERRRDLLLWWACAMRVAMAIPRPILWWRIYRLYRGAARERSTLRVAQRLLAATRDKWVRYNAVFNNIYNVWLLMLLLRLMYRWVYAADQRSQFEVALCWHACWCVLFMVTSHLVSALAILYKIHTGHADHPMLARQLEHCTECILVDDQLQQRLADDTCIVCLSKFDAAQHVRRLPRCGHHFHQHCIDHWLLRPGVRTMSCPICACEIGVGREEQHDPDPLVTRELAWLAELRRAHPGLL